MLYLPLQYHFYPSYVCNHALSSLVVAKQIVARLNMHVHNFSLISSLPDLCLDRDKAPKLWYSPASHLALIVFDKSIVIRVLILTDEH